MERTLAIVKPDAVASGSAGAILARIEQEGFRIVALRMVRLGKAQAEAFYAVHRERPFYPSLTDFMSSGPCIPMVLEREEAIPHWREVMGATDPAVAQEGTLRATYGESVERNAVHGSDARDTARVEIAFFFPGLDLI